MRLTANSSLYGSDRTVTCSTFPSSCWRMLAFGVQHRRERWKCAHVDNLPTENVILTGLASMCHHLKLYCNLFFRGPCFVCPLISQFFLGLLRFLQVGLLPSRCPGNSEQEFSHISGVAFCASQTISRTSLSSLWQSLTIVSLFCATSITWVKWHPLHLQLFNGHLHFVEENK